MTGNARTLKEGESKITKSTTKKSGKAKNGKPTKPISSGIIHIVGYVTLNLKYPITQISKSMENQNISLSLEPSLIAISATMENTRENSNARYAVKSDPYSMERDAIRVLGMEIERAFNEIGMPVTSPGTNATGKTTGSTTRKKKSIPKPESGSEEMTKITKKDLHLTIMRLRERVNHYSVGVNDNTQEIKNILRTLRLHGEGHMANDLTPQFRELCKKVEEVRDRMDVLECQDAHTCHNVAALGEDRKRIIALEEAVDTHPGAPRFRDHFGTMISRITDLEKQLEKQYHENAVAHIQQSDTIMHMKEQIKGLENRLSRAQDMIAECHPDGCIVVKNKKKPVGKIQG